MTVLKSTAGRGFAQVGIKLSADKDGNEQRAAETGQGITRIRAGSNGILEEKKRSLSLQTSGLDFFKSSSVTCASPPV